MTYNALLDCFFSTYWISIIAPLGLIPLYYLFRSKIRKGKENSFGEVCVVMGYAFVVVMTAGMANPLLWGYGSPEAVRAIRYADGKLLVIDHIRTMGSETDEGTPCSRVHVIDPVTGEKLFRFTLGEEADLLGVLGDTLVVAQYNNATAYSLSDGEKIVTYSEETLPDLFPELASGINNIMWGSSNNTMGITTNNGKQYILYLVTGKLVATEEITDADPHAPSGRLYCEEHSIKRDTEQWGSAVLELDGQNGNQYELFLENGHDSVQNRSISFLAAEFIAVNNADSTCIILSYETLEHTEFILTCVTLDGKEVVWQIHQAQYNSEYDFNDYWKPHTGYNESTNQLTFWIEHEVYCVDAATGKLLWQTGL